MSSSLADKHQAKVRKKFHVQVKISRMEDDRVKVEGKWHKFIQESQKINVLGVLAILKLCQHHISYNHPSTKCKGYQCGNAIWLWLLCEWFFPSKDCLVKLLKECMVDDDNILLCIVRNMEGALPWNFRLDKRILIFIQLKKKTGISLMMGIVMGIYVNSTRKHKTNELEYTIYLREPLVIIFAPGNNSLSEHFRIKNSSNICTIVC